MKNSKIEETQGSILVRLQQTILKMSILSNYTPYQASDSLAEMQLLRNTLEAVDGDLALALANYRVEAKHRSNAFYTDEYSLNKLLKYIRSVIDNNYSKKSPEVQVIAAQIRKIRCKPLTKKATTEEDKGEEEAKEEELSAADIEALAAEEAAAAAEEAAEEEEQEDKTEAKPKKKRRKNSHSQRSYAAMIHGFRNLLQMVSGMIYNPFRTEMQLGGLKNFAQQLDTMNGEVGLKLDKVNALRQQRDELTQSALVRIQRIKNNLRLEHGIQSAAYRSIKDV